MGPKFFAPTRMDRDLGHVMVVGILVLTARSAAAACNANSASHCMSTFKTRFTVAAVPEQTPLQATKEDPAAGVAVMLIEEPGIHALAAAGLSRRSLSKWTQMAYYANK